MSEYWVELIGDVDAIQDMPNVLPRVRVRNFIGRMGFSSASWDQLNGVELLPLRTDALTLISTFNEARALLSAPTNVLVGPTVWETRGHEIVRQATFIVAALPCIQVRAVLATVQVGDVPVAPPARPVGERLLALQSRNRNFQRATAIFVGCGDGIPALWVVWEYIRTEHGGHKRIAEKGWATKAELGGFAETADYRGHRHSLLKAEAIRLKHTYPEMSGGQARALIQRLLLCWLDEAEPTS